MDVSGEARETATRPDRDPRRSARRRGAAGDRRSSEEEWRWPLGVPEYSRGDCLSAQITTKRTKRREPSARKTRKQSLSCLSWRFSGPAFVSVVVIDVLSGLESLGVDPVLTDLVVDDP